MKFSWKYLAAGALTGAAVGAAVLAAKKHAPGIAGQTVLITGGSRGLGLALAREFGRYGCRIAIAARTAHQVERAREILEGEGFGEVAAYVCDITDASQVQELVQSVETRFGGIDILVNNAGVIITGPAQDMTERDFEHAMNTMFWGPYRLIQAVLPGMRERGAGGRIVNVSSIGGKIAVPHMLPYCCAKFALVALSDGLRLELAKEGIQVTTVAPWLTRTGGEANAIFKGNTQSEARWFSLLAASPLVAQSAEIAARQIVKATVAGRGELILSVGAFATRIRTLLPGATDLVLRLTNNLLLPSPTGDRAQSEQGKEVLPFERGLVRALTADGRKAGSRLNQEPA
ncbi:ketoacyl reductase [Bryobacterales bacterium F-183]|nr:ketoacyl reductase [Bryobacterales bacterium F-183]